MMISRKGELFNALDQPLACRLSYKRDKSFIHTFFCSRRVGASASGLEIMVSKIENYVGKSVFII